MSERTVRWYEDACASVSFYPEDRALEYVLLGLAGEAGELCNKSKEVLRDDKCVLSRDKRLAMIDEAGDVMFYMARLAHELGTDLDHIMRANVDKLASRKRRGVLGGEGDRR